MVTQYLNALKLARAKGVVGENASDDVIKAEYIRIGGALGIDHEEAPAVEVKSIKKTIKNVKTAVKNITKAITKTKARK